MNAACLQTHPALPAWLRIRPIPGQLKKVADILRRLPEITECDRVTGEDCFIARACQVALEKGGVYAYAN